MTELRLNITTLDGQHAEVTCSSTETVHSLKHTIRPYFNNLPPWKLKLVLESSRVMSCHCPLAFYADEAGQAPLQPQQAPQAGATANGWSLCLVRDLRAVVDSTCPYCEQEAQRKEAQTMIFDEAPQTPLNPLNTNP
jgi:hypothetical protein